MKMKLDLGHDVSIAPPPDPPMVEDGRTGFPSAKLRVQKNCAQLNKGCLATRDSLVFG